MSCVFKRVLPFILTLVLGLAATAVLRRSLFRATGNRRPACPVTVPWSESEVSVEITDVLYSGLISKSTIGFEGGRNGSIGPRDWTQTEEALWSRTLVNTGMRVDHIISYIATDTPDGRPATSDALLTDLPRPLFWGDKERNGSLPPYCNVIVRVSLDSSGRVSTVEEAPGHSSCAFLSDILEAARGVGFRPAMRDGHPVSERISILYLTH